MAHLVTVGLSRSRRTIKVLLLSDDQWRRLRRCARETLTQTACRNHINIQQAEATQLLYDILTCPEVSRTSPLTLFAITFLAFKGFFDSIRRFSTSAILSVLYGKRAPRIVTPEVTAFFKAQHHWEELMVRLPRTYSADHFWMSLIVATWCAPTSRSYPDHEVYT